MEQSARLYNSLLGMMKQEPSGQHISKVLCKVRLCEESGTMKSENGVRGQKGRHVSGIRDTQQELMNFTNS